MNILIIGLGSIANKHIAALIKLKIDFKIYALRSKPNALSQNGVENIYSLDNINVVFDFAIISNPTYLHYEYIEKLAKKGIDLFIEKPAIHSLDNYEKLIKIVNDNNIKTYVACNLRFHPCLKFLRDRINSEKLIINEVNVYCGSYLPNWRPGADFRKNYSAIASMGGGVHLDLFHELDYTVWLFGLPIESKSFLKNSSSLNISSVDYANYILGYDSFTSNIILNYYRSRPKREIEIVFENEIWNIDLIRNEIKTDSEEFLYRNSSYEINQTYSEQLEYFIDCLKNNKYPMNGLSESIEILKICLNND
jgi:predicted dehydrogenase